MRVTGMPGRLRPWCYGTSGSNELWLSGCGAGYRGEGPSGAGYILLKEGFPHEQLRLVLTCEPLHLVKGTEPRVAERKPDSVDRPHDAQFVKRLLRAEAEGNFDPLQND
jgi:hypothetical protein